MKSSKIEDQRSDKKFKKTFQTENNMLAISSVSVLETQCKIYQWMVFIADHEHCSFFNFLN